MAAQVKQTGFTIVELLIVIVIIAILAAITVVAYTGITNRANTSSAKAAANSALKKLEAYASETTANGGGDGSYPAYPSLLTSAASARTYQLTGVSFSDSASAPTTAPTGPSVLLFYACSTGARVDYWDYGAKVWTAIYTGSGNLTACTATGYGYKRATATS